MSTETAEGSARTIGYGKSYPVTMPLGEMLSAFRAWAAPAFLRRRIKRLEIDMTNAESRTSPFVTLWAYGDARKRDLDCLEDMVR